MLDPYSNEDREQDDVEEIEDDRDYDEPEPVDYNYEDESYWRIGE